jgi:hypothetical protein
MWREHAAKDPDWAAEQLHKGFQQNNRLREEIQQLRAGIIKNGDALIDQIQHWLLEHYRVEINLSTDRIPGPPLFEVRFYDCLGRQRGWAVGSGDEVRKAARWAMQNLQTVAERDPELGAVLERQRNAQRADPRERPVTEEPEGT